MFSLLNLGRIGRLELLPSLSTSGLEFLAQEIAREASERYAGLVCPLPKLEGNIAVYRNFEVAASELAYHFYSPEDLRIVGGVVLVPEVGGFGIGAEFLRNRVQRFFFCSRKYPRRVDDPSITLGRLSRLAIIQRGVAQPNPTKLYRG